MAGWRVTSWDRAKGRGSISSGVGTLAFDASAALVDDFRIGEEVDVRLEPAGGSYVVRQIAPTFWRAPAAPSIEALQPSLEPIASALHGRDLILRGLDDEQTLLVEIREDTYAPRRAIAFDVCVFVQATIELDEAASIDVVRAGELRAADLAFAPAGPLADDQPVFVIGPSAFAHGAWYIAARSARLVTSADWRTPATAR